MDILDVVSCHVSDFLALHKTEPLYTSLAVLVHLKLSELVRTHLLLAGNDTVPISLWRGGGMHSTECLLAIITFAAVMARGQQPSHGTARCVRPSWNGVLSTDKRNRETEQIIYRCLIVVLS